ncbi:PLP-dependent transferase [Pantoea ananatis]
MTRNGNALAIDYLKQQPLVKTLYHPSLPENAGHEFAARQQRGFSAMLSLSWMAMKPVRRFLKALELFTLAESLGGVESLISHTATMTHAGMSAGPGPQQASLKHCYVFQYSIEDHEDLIADLDNAFRIAAED